MVSELKELLPLTPNSDSQDQLHIAKDKVTEAIGKQIKLLFNQSLATLAKWSEILDNTPDTSNASSKENNNANVAAKDSGSASTSYAPHASSKALLKSQKTYTLKTSVAKVVHTKTRQVTAVKSVRAASLTKGSAPVAEDTLASNTPGTRNTRKHDPIYTKSELNLHQTNKPKGSSVTVVETKRPETEPDKSRPTISSPMPAVDGNSIYDSDRPTYAHIAILVDIGFISIRMLELIGNSIPSSLFEIEKARSNLISKIIQLGMYLFSFPFPRAISAPETPAVGEGQEHSMTFIRLVQALHNNAVRCWMDVRNGSLAYLLPEMMSHSGSPYEWCMCIARIQLKAGTQSLDALFRLMFIAAGKAIDTNPSREGHSHSYLLRMHGIKYHGACAYLTKSIDGMIWDKMLRCGVEYEKSTRDGQTRDDILLLLKSYMSTFEILSQFELADHTSVRFQEWYKHASHLSQKVDDPVLKAFVGRLGDNMDMDITKEATTTAGTTQPPLMLIRHGSSPSTISEVKPKVALAEPTYLGTEISAEKTFARLDEAVKILRKFEDSLQHRLSKSLSGHDVTIYMEKAKTSLLALERDLTYFSKGGISITILQNIARIFRSMDNIRSIGSKFVDKYENDKDATNVDKEVLTPLLSASVVTRLLSDVTVRLWDYSQEEYFRLYNSNQKIIPNPSKLSCARVDAILFLCKLYQSNIVADKDNDLASMIKYLESAFSTANSMHDHDSLLWISNALFNLGGALYKSNRCNEAIKPLELSISYYTLWLKDDLAVDNSLHAKDIISSTKSEKKFTLANRYEILGICYQSINNLNQALSCFNWSLCALPLISFQNIDNIAPGELKTSHLPAAKLLNRRARVMFMMEDSHFVSITMSVPEFESKVTRADVPIHIRGIVQEFESRLLSALCVKSNRISYRAREQVEILKNMLSKIYRGGRFLTNPIRRARVLMQLAVIYQEESEISHQQEALDLVDEAIEILKVKDLKLDSEFEPVRNHNLALAYSWSGILDRNRGDGLLRKSKSFQIALQLWEIILSEIDCFTSSEDIQLANHQSKVNKVRRHLPEPEALYDHLQMLADCLGMIDYRVLQVQVYRIMLRLCNGVMATSDGLCTDAVRIYARMGGAYLALGYSGKAKIALNHGKSILDEMTITLRNQVLHGNAHTTWLLVYSLYLTSVGDKGQSVSAYNQAKQQSNKQLLSESRDGIFSGLSKSGVLSHRVEAKIYKAIVIAEASLARSQLQLHEGNLSEAITDSKRAGRQLSRIVSTLSKAIKEAQAKADPAIITPIPMENPFLVPGTPTAQSAKDLVSSESQQLRDGLEILATQRFQWSIFKLLIDAYHQLGKLYLMQGSAREAEYFFIEGRCIAAISKAGKSIDRFTLDQAELKLRQRDWQGCHEFLQELAMGEDESTSGGLAWEIQDARAQLFSGDLYFESNQLELSLQAYYRTDQLLLQLMDKSFISGLEQLAICEPQTPREANLINVNGWQGIENHSGVKQRHSIVGSIEIGTPDQAQFECVTLKGIKAALGYRTGMIYGLDDRVLEAYELIEDSRTEDPMGFTVAEYHFTKAKLLVLELQAAMAEHILYAMTLDSALSVGLFKKTRTQQIELPPGIYGQSKVMEINGQSASTADQFHSSYLSSPSARVTKVSRRRRSQLANEELLRSPSRSRAAIPNSTGNNVVKHYSNILMQAREQLSEAYTHSIQVYSPHVISSICSLQTLLFVLESCFYQDVLGDDASALVQDFGDRGDIHWEMASRAACYLEMTKSITQHREMHGLIKQKLYPDLPQEDQSWPRDIQVKSHHYQKPGHDSSGRQGAKPKPQIQRLGSKTINIVGLEKPKPLILFESADDEQDPGVEINNNLDGDDDMEEDEDMDLRSVQMKSEDLKSPRGKREYFERQSQTRPSTSLGNDRVYLEMMDKVYEKDSFIAGECPETFQKDFIDILPSNWTVVSLSMDSEVLYVNRMRASTIPIVVRLPLNRVQLREGEDQDIQMSPSEGFDEEDSREPIEPISYKDALEELQAILKASQETLALTSSKHHLAAAGSSSLRPIELTREAKVEWWRQRQELDHRLCALLMGIEEQWLGGLKGLIQSHNTPSDTSNLIGFKKTLEWIMSQAINSVPSRRASQRSGSSRKEPLAHLDINLELCHIILHLGDTPSYAEVKDLIYFLLDAYMYNSTNPSKMSTTSTSGLSTSSAPMIDYSEIQFDKLASQIKEALSCYWEAEIRSKNNGFDEGAHIILILDKHLQVFPWESCPVLREEAVSRIPSMWLLRDRILYQRYKISKANLSEPLLGKAESFPSTKTGLDNINHSEWHDLELDPQKTFYVLNPGGDLKNTENEFKGFVKSQTGWDGVIGRAPLDLECIRGLSNCDLYIYFGHSGGEQYIKSSQIRQLGQCAVSLLLGCSSGSLKSEGEFDPTGNAMNYLLAGCPAVVANLWDVTDKDLDRFSKEVFSLWGLGADDYTTSVRHSLIEDSDGNSMDEHVEGETGIRLSLVEAVKEARESAVATYHQRLIQEWPRLVVALVSLYGIYYAANIIKTASSEIQSLNINSNSPMDYESPQLSFGSNESSSDKNKDIRNSSNGASMKYNDRNIFGNIRLYSSSSNVNDVDFDGHHEAAAVYALLVISSLSIIDNGIGLMVVTRRSLRLTQVAFGIWCLRFLFRILSLVSVIFMLTVGADPQKSHSLPILDVDVDVGLDYKNSANGDSSVSSSMMLTILEITVAAVHGWSLLVLIRDLRNQPRPRTALARAWFWFCGTKWGNRLGLDARDASASYSVHSNMVGYADMESGGGSIWDREIAASLGLSSGLLSSASSIRSVAVSIPEMVISGASGRSRASSISSFSSAEKV
ncbi:hypothetical protein BGZ76_004090 [Entomortierella beljakovae]|nr:hypothetical protein BGZ76_004090 [Entomortierella beljakovae]